MEKYNRVYNFSAGPAAIPTEVLEQVRDELLNYHDSGMSVMEMSHRSQDFTNIIEEAEANLRSLLNVSEEYAVLFLQGGASTQFAMAPMNLAGPGKKVALIQTGNWTKKASKEIEKIAKLEVIASTEDTNFDRLPDINSLPIPSDAAYVHMCSNNTIYGTEFFAFPDTGDIPLVCDMSSDILSRSIEVNNFGMIFAGAQKNLGPSGVTLVIIRKDLAERADKSLPTMFQYRTHIEKKSLYNTPPTFAIYVLGLVLKWVQKQGGLEAIEKRNIEKANLLYQAIDNLDFYTSPVQKENRSRMNVVFRIAGADKDEQKAKLEKKFVEEAAEAGLKTLKGHRSVGGLRASIYNAMPIEGVKALVEFMEHFAEEHS
ncbi:MAG: 3-phosphoserine/phosphohydroxythreonine transaminase [Candidatus Hydrogenedentota bacterium]|nr:MAG: 3-phosphoserine/phosphohydroxythreonine transaminase [Candidatus Hydrogenedentota bacterium]